MPFSIETFYPERGNALCLFSEDVKTKLFSKNRLSTLNITNVIYRTNSTIGFLECSNLRDIF